MARRSARPRSRNRDRSSSRTSGSGGPRGAGRPCRKSGSPYARSSAGTRSCWIARTRSVPVSPRGELSSRTAHADCVQVHPPVGGYGIALIHVDVGAVEVEHEVLVDRGGLVGVPAIRRERLAVEERIATVAAQAGFVQEIGPQLVGAFVGPGELIRPDESPAKPRGLEEAEIVHVAQPSRHPLQDLKIDEEVDATISDIVERRRETMSPEVFADTTSDPQGLHRTSVGADRGSGRKRFLP